MVFWHAITEGNPLNINNIPCVPADQPHIAWLVATVQRIHDLIRSPDHIPDKPRRRSARAKDVMEITRLKRSTFYAMQNPKSSTHDPSFPRPFYIGKSPRWWLHEIEAWLESHASTATSHH